MVDDFLWIMLRFCKRHVLSIDLFCAEYKNLDMVGERQTACNGFYGALHTFV